MRMSCNGCRVLRKACGEKCSIRPCLQWMKSPESQANATVFLAKFYGRAGLVNLLDAAHPDLRPAVFRSLLYEACGRIVNPVYGSVGLLWSGSWALCQTAVDAVLAGTPITPVSADAPAAAAPSKGCDIRHVVKGGRQTTLGSGELHRVGEARTRFKRAGRDKSKTGKIAALEELHGLSSPSGHSSSSHGESTVSVEVAEASGMARANALEAVAVVDGFKGGVEEGKTRYGAGLDLRLGLGFEN